jgi:choline dehydrogenase
MVQNSLHRSHNSLCYLTPDQFASCKARIVTLKVSGDIPLATEQVQTTSAEYIVVGSGAGGGTLAARLAEAGRTVLLLEAGADPRDASKQTQPPPPSGGVPNDYDVPVFHGFASENDALKWDFWVRHYSNDEQQKKDPNYREIFDGKRVDGVLYPRAGTLGGCTAHNAMIFVYPHNADWDYIADLTGDESWRPERMRRYFELLENCQYRGLHRWLAKLGYNPTRHGWKGWLHTQKAIPDSALMDRTLVDMIVQSTVEAFRNAGSKRDHLRWLLKGALDPNDWRLVQEDAGGVRYTPLTTRNRMRIGSRERVLEVAAKHPEHLRIELNALATRVLLDENNRAIGVEYLKGKRMYRAHAAPSKDSGDLRIAHASREVILAGGAFNSPQLLMLSGIGPAEQLARHRIPLRVDLPGVGRNLQDRYEVPVVNRMDFKQWEVFKNARFAEGDPQFKQWQRARDGVYTTNGSVLTAFKRSSPDRALPDIFCLAILGLFRGYAPKYSTLFAENLNYLTWVVLKAHTNNRAGEVTLRTTDPRDVPAINFHYFEEGSDSTGEDLDAVVEGIKFVRKITQAFKDRKLIAEEELPGCEAQSDEQLRAFVRRHAWGHHAAGTCAIGAREDGGVLGSDFKVHCTQDLRVVDASIFPRIPGFFIASAVYMAAEKAAKVILEPSH